MTARDKPSTRTETCNTAGHLPGCRADHQDDAEMQRCAVLVTKTPTARTDTMLEVQVERLIESGRINSVATVARLQHDGTADPVELTLAQVRAMARALNSAGDLMEYGETNTWR
ncbi:MULTISPECIES: hypothetical protein [Bacteria]|nr:MULTISPECIES: hypothetical protein [Bacteria]